MIASAHAVGARLPRPWLMPSRIHIRSRSNRVRVWPGYQDLVAGVARSNLVAHWPLWEESGAVAYDISGNGLNGAHTGVSLGMPGIGDGRPAPYYDGANDYTNIYSAGLNSAFNGSEGTAMIWWKVGSAGIWTDGTSHYALRIRVDNNNYIIMHKTNVDGRMRMQYVAGGTVETQLESGLSDLDWRHYVVTWSATANEARFYSNSTELGTATALGTWAGNLDNTTTLIGALITTPTTVWNGWLAHCAIWNTPLTAAQVAQLYEV